MAGSMQKNVQMAIYSFNGIFNSTFTYLTTEVYVDYLMRVQWYVLRLRIWHEGGLAIPRASEGVDSNETPRIRIWKETNTLV